MGEGGIRVLEGYREALERGTPSTPEEWLSTYAGVAEDVAGELRLLRLFQAARQIMDADSTLEQPKAGQTPPEIDSVFQPGTRVGEWRPYLKAVVGRIFQGRLAGKEDESDVVQDAVVRGIRRLAQCNGQSPEQTLAWLVAIVRNRALNKLRYWNEQERAVEREQPIAGGSSNGVALAAGSSTPSERAIRREEAARLAAAVEQLPPNYREVIRLREFEGLSHAEVAQGMGRWYDVVRQLWVRALKQLRARLGGDQ
jgi:RNA polymerase sigma-70 factor (ECF subfamily)